MDTLEGERVLGQFKGFQKASILGERNRWERNLEGRTGISRACWLQEGDSADEGRNLPKEFRHLHFCCFPSSVFYSRTPQITPKTMYLHPFPCQ